MTADGEEPTFTKQPSFTKRPFWKRPYCGIGNALSLCKGLDGVTFKVVLAIGASIMLVAYGVMAFGVCRGVLRATHTLGDVIEDIGAGMKEGSPIILDSMDKIALMIVDDVSRVEAAVMKVVDAVDVAFTVQPADGDNPAPSLIDMAAPVIEKLKRAVVGVPGGKVDATLVGDGGGRG